VRLDESGRAPSPPLHDLRDLGLDGIPVEELNLPLIHLLDAALDFGVLVTQSYFSFWERRAPTALLAISGLSFQ
jgi:hypothetical protein